MSATSDPKRLTPPDILARKGDTPLVMLTAYTTPSRGSSMPIAT